MTTLDNYIKLLIDSYGIEDSVFGTFYYDETNIFHKLRLTEKGANNNIVQQSFFGLGGLYLEKNQQLNLDELFSVLKPQKSMKEFKYKFFSHGNSNIIDALNSNRFLILMEWLNKNSVSLHFTLMDYLYYGIVDIIDSLPDASISEELNRNLKSTLYDIVRRNIDLFLELFYDFEYPNIAKEKVKEFTDKFYNIYLSLIEYDNTDVYDFPKEFLRQMIKSAMKTNELVFLHDNEPFELFSQYAHLYIDRPVRFPNSLHKFDDVTEIEDTLSSWDNNYMRKLNSEFLDSSETILIQLSDAIIGLISRVSNLILNSNFDELSALVSKLNANQISVLNYMFDSINRGIKKSRFYNQLICSNSFLLKNNFFINLIVRKGRALNK